MAVTQNGAMVPVIPTLEALRARVRLKMEPGSFLSELEIVRKISPPEFLATFAAHFVLFSLWLLQFTSAVFLSSRRPVVCILVRIATPLCRR